MFNLISTAKAALIDVPSATTTLADIGTWSSSIFTDLLPYAKMVIGLVLAPLLVGLLISYLIKAFRH